MRDRMDDRLIQEPRIRRTARRRPAPAGSSDPASTPDDPGVPPPRAPQREERTED